MKAIANNAPATAAAHNPQAAHPPLETVTRSHVATDAASFYLLRKPQTLRHWASSEAGAMRPIRLNGRLAWSVAEIKKLLNGGI